ncbi:MAG: tetratricopeptide repeat protein [Tannerellaceae bacterium]|nr:tetratricopeptide repeat protein [Tannerellaceae bacterium]
MKISCLQVILLVFIALAVVLIFVVKWPILGYILGSFFLFILLVSFAPPPKPFRISPKHLDTLTGQKRKLYLRTIDSVERDIKERLNDKYKITLSRYLARDDYDAAIKSLQINPDKPIEAANRCILIAKLCIIDARFREAEEYFQKAMVISPTVYTMSAMGDFYFDLGMYAEAKQNYERCLSMELPPLNKINVLNCLGMTLRDWKKYPAAEKVFAEALDIARKLAAEDRPTYGHELAKILDNYAILCQYKEDFEMADKCYREALETYWELAKTDKEQYLPLQAQVLSYLGEIHWHQQHLEKAEEYHTEALELNRHLAKTNPAKYNQALASSLNNMGVIHGAKRKFDEAEELLAQALKMRRGLAEADPSTYNPVLAETLSNLGNVYIGMNEYPKAEALLTESEHLCRTLAKLSPNPWNYYLVKTLICLADFYLQGRPDKALSVRHAKDAIRVIEQSHDQNLESEHRQANQILKKWRNA